MESQVSANDRLLKALIALLALREPGFMQQLQTVFVLAAREDNRIGQASEATWEEIGAELRAIREFLAVESPDQRFDA